MGRRIVIALGIIAALIAVAVTLRALIDEKKRSDRIGGAKAQWAQILLFNVGN